MMTLIAAALVAAAQAAPAQPADAHAHQHGQHGQHQGQHGPAQPKGMECCKHHSADHKMDCCKGMADAAKAKGCCAEHAKGETQGQHQRR